jgi:hypothetical protein
MEEGRRRRPAAEGIGLSREGVVQGRSKLLITLDRLKGSLRRCTRGQHGQRPDDGEQSRWRRPLPTRKLDSIPGEADAHGSIASWGRC